MKAGVFDGSGIQSLDMCLGIHAAGFEYDNVQARCDQLQGNRNACCASADDADVCMQYLSVKKFGGVEFHYSLWYVDELRNLSQSANRRRKNGILRAKCCRVRDLIHGKTADEATSSVGSRAARFCMNLTHHLDDFDVSSFASVANDFGHERFGYVVTPNVDHMIRYYDDSKFRSLYAEAEYVLLDSRFMSYLLRAVKGVRIKVCPGSDLTAHLIKHEVRPEDRIVLIGCSEEQASKLAQMYNLRGLQHHNPPMGFIKSPEAVEEALQFVERHSPFRFCLIAVGSPQQEIFAQKLKERGQAKGLGLCIGASINFLTGLEQRAPVWMQKAGFEWAFRLGQDPKRLAKRYLVRGPRIFKLLRKLHFELRPAPVLRTASASLITATSVDTQLPESS